MNRAAFLAFCLLAFNLSAFADFHSYQKMGPAQLAIIASSESRTTIDLSGSWQRVVDGAVVGEVSIPACENITERMQLRKSVKINASILEDRTWSLYFMGVSDEIEVRINGRAAMRYPGGLVPFTVRIPERTLTAGTNVIDISFAEPGAHTALSQKFGRHAAKRTMGLLREVLLVGTPHAWVQDVRVRSVVNSGSASVNVRSTVNGGNIDRLLGGTTRELNNGKAQVTVEAVLASPQGDVVARSTPAQVTVEHARQTPVSCDLTVFNPSLWSPATPTLYTLTIRVSMNGRVIDDVHEQVGLRSVRIGTTDHGRRLFLNDSAIFLNAIEYVEEYPLVRSSMSYRQIEHDVSMLKTLGVNVVRVRNSSPHPYFLYMCDKYGLMVMVELPATDLPTGILVEDETIAMVRNAAERTINYVDNHPSVIACGLGTRLEEGVDATSEYFASHVKKFRASSQKLLFKVVPSALLDRVSEGGFDLVVVDFADATARMSMDKVLRTATRSIRTACVLVGTGSVVSPLNRNGITDPLSHETQAVVIRDAYRAAVSMGLGGCMVSTFNDYRLEMPTMLVDVDDPYVCTYGLVDMWRQPRVAYSMYKALINDEKEPLMQARAHDNQTPLVFIVTGLVLGLFLVLLVNRSRRFREYLMRAIVRPYNFYADIRDQRILSTIQTTLLGMVISSSVGLVLASLLHFSRTNPRVEYVMHIILPWPISYEVVRFIAWHPAIAVVACSVGMLLLFAGIATLLRIGAMFIRGRIFWRDTFTIVVWSALPLVALLPVGIAFYQLLNTDSMTVSLWLSIVVLVVGTWFVIRTLRSTSVVFDIRSSFVYLYGTAVLFVMFAAGFWMYSIKFDAADFLQYYAAVVNAS